MTDWNQFVSYTCRHRDCQSNCINRVSSRPAQTKQCRDCYEEHDPETLNPLSHHLPRFARGGTPITPDSATSK